MHSFETSTLIMLHESNKTVVAKCKWSMLNKSVSHCRISDLKKANTMEPGLSRADHNTSVLKKHDDLFTDGTESPRRRSRHDLCHHVFLVAPRGAMRRRDEGARKPKSTTIDDVMPSRNEVLGVKLIVCHGRDLLAGRGGKWIWWR
jgi:hypothetical protein